MSEESKVYQDAFRQLHCLTPEQVQGLVTLLSAFNNPSHTADTPPAQAEPSSSVKVEGPYSVDDKFGASSTSNDASVHTPSMDAARDSNDGSNQEQLPSPFDHEQHASTVIILVISKFGFKITDIKDTLLERLNEGHTSDPSTNTTVASTEDDKQPEDDRSSAVEKRDEESMQWHFVSCHGKGESFWESMTSNCDELETFLRRDVLTASDDTPPTQEPSPEQQGELALDASVKSVLPKTSRAPKAVIIDYRSRGIEDLFYLECMLETMNLAITGVVGLEFELNEVLHDRIAEWERQNNAAFSAVHRAASRAGVWSCVEATQERATLVEELHQTFSIVAKTLGDKQKQSSASPLRTRSSLMRAASTFASSRSSWVNVATANWRPKVFPISTGQESIPLVTNYRVVRRILGEVRDLNCPSKSATPLRKSQLGDGAWLKTVFVRRSVEGEHYQLFHNGYELFLVPRHMRFLLSVPLDAWTGTPLHLLGRFLMSGTLTHLVRDRSKEVFLVQQLDFISERGQTANLAKTMNPVERHAKVGGYLPSVLGLARAFSNIASEVAIANCQLVPFERASVLFEFAEVPMNGVTLVDANHQKFVWRPLEDFSFDFVLGDSPPRMGSPTDKRRTFRLLAFDHQKHRHMPLPNDPHLGEGVVRISVRQVREHGLVPGVLIACRPCFREGSTEMSGWTFQRLRQTAVVAFDLTKVRECLTEGNIDHDSLLAAAALLKPQEHKEDEKSKKPSKGDSKATDVEVSNASFLANSQLKDMLDEFQMGEIQNLHEFLSGMDGDGSANPKPKAVELMEGNTIVARGVRGFELAMSKFPAPPSKFFVPMLGFIGGFTDSYSVLELAQFTAHITGTSVYLGMAPTLHSMKLIPRLVQFALFIFSCSFTRASSFYFTPYQHRVLCIGLQVVFFLFAAALGCPSCPRNLLDYEPQTYLLMTALVLAMGIQNVYHRLYLVGKPLTALITGNTTQIMMDLVDVVYDKNPLPAIKRIRANLVANMCFLLGCCLAGIVYTNGSDRALILLPVASLFTLFMVIQQK